jgi:glycosyltransferase involved in cell wall biosynthesis
MTQFETTRVPRIHVRHINYCDHLIVTSSYQVEVMRNSGVTIPIDAMTAGIDTDYFTYKSWLDRKKDGKFKILLTGALTDRKNPLMAIRIFQRASEGNPDWSLTLKTRATEGLNKVAAEVKKDRRIKLFVSDSHPDQIRQLYHSHDVFLWPSKGEGVGLPPLEAMATGMEVIVSANSGMLDYVDSSWCWPIRTEGTESAVGVGKFSKKYVANYGEVGDWWLPSEDHAVEQLKQCFDKWYKNHGKGKAAAEYVRKAHNVKVQARSIRDVIEKYG